MNPKIAEQVPIGIYDLKKEIKKIEKRDKELSVRTLKVDEYLNQFAVLKQGDADELEKELMAMDIPRMKETMVKKILDLLPASVEELKVILQGYAITVSKENMQKVVNAVKKYNPEKP